MTTTTALSQKGSLQPQLSSCSTGRSATGRNTTVASEQPTAQPTMTKLVKNPRRPTGECSTVNVEAPADSAPAEKP